MRAFIEHCGRRTSRGISLIEIIVVVAIMGLFAEMSVQSFVSLNRTQALEKEATSVVSLLAQARSRTLASEDLSRYGVHFATTSVALFKGSTYSASDPNTTTFSLSLVNISNIALSGGGRDVIFDRLTGKTSQFGSVTLSLISDSTATKTVSIYVTGVADHN